MTITTMLKSIDLMKAELEETYKHFHAHPELSMQEVKTRTKIAELLRDYGYTVQEIGGGVVGVLENGVGPKVLFRADIDGLPLKEVSNLPYASTVEMTNAQGVTVPVMHACGHDFHITAGLGTARALAENKDLWQGTYIALFQPGEEIAAGARAMVDDGLVNKIPKPDIALAQHVMPNPVAGKIGTTAGPFLSSAASAKIIIKGKGAHGSMPNLGIDPIVIGASIVNKLQTIVSREVDPFNFAVVTVGSFQAGAVANIIPNEATLLLNIRAYNEDIKAQLIKSIERIVIAECQAGGAQEEPEISFYDNYPLTDNDPEVTDKVTEAFKTYLGEDNVIPYKPFPASEDFSTIADALGAPYLYWGFGGYTPNQEVFPNHSPHFVPALQPTLETGTKAALIAALTYLAK